MVRKEDLRRTLGRRLRSQTTKPKTGPRMALRRLKTAPKRVSRMVKRESRRRSKALMMMAYVQNARVSC